jgi:hypothetical protein
MTHGRDRCRIYIEVPASTNTPLELDKPSHLEALMRAYERFPEIGGRVTPR